jgi:3-mercaptopyruvate sulfurtransferase SseA
LKYARTTGAGLGLILLTLLMALSACQARPRTQDGVPRMAPSVLKQRLDAGEEVLVVDARSAGSYEARHIRGAISIPLDELESRMDELARDQEIVFY